MSPSETVEFIEPPPGFLPPPGLAPPPGLDLPTDECSPSSSHDSSSPPGLKPVETILTYDVKITGLPNCVLSNMGMEAMLEQAGFEKSALAFVSTVGKPCGEVFVAFSSLCAALQCVHHFSGCQWDASGAGVSAMILEAFDSNMLPPAAVPAMALADMIEHKAFPPASLEHGLAFSFSTDAPCFVPSEIFDFCADKLNDVHSAIHKSASLNSDTSTDMGESEADDDKSGDGETHATQMFVT